MWMTAAQITLTQPEGTSRQFDVTTGSGHRLRIDDDAGATGPKPIELAVAALAGCTAFDVIGILRKKRQKVTACEVRVSADQAPDPPQVFTRARIVHRVSGEDIDPAAVERAIHLSETKYCSVGAMIARTAELVTSFEIVPSQAGGPVLTGVVQS
jgi:putative redox protein